MKKIISLLIILNTVFLCYSIAQNSDNKIREIGIRLYGFNDLDFIYKKQKSENKFTRIRLASGSWNIPSFNSFSTNLTIGLKYGKEKRKPITEQLSFMGGWEIGESFSTAASENYYSLSLTPYVGAVLGFNYSINQKFNLSLECTPGMSAVFSVANEDFTISNIGIGFNSNSLALGLTYKF